VKVVGRDPSVVEKTGRANGKSTHPISIRQPLRTILDPRLEDSSEPVCVEDLTCLEELREGAGNRKITRSATRQDEEDRKRGKEENERVGEHDILSSGNPSSCPRIEEGAPL